MNLVALLGSVCTHGAVVVTASPDRYCNGQAVARLHDMVSCPYHGLNPIISVQSTSETNSLSTAHVLATSACGAMILTGSTDVYVG